MRLTPEDDKEFHPRHWIPLKAAYGDQTFEVNTWVGKPEPGAHSGPDGDEFDQKLMNFEMRYRDQSGNENRVNAWFTPEDVERLGIVLQYAASAALEKKGGN